MEQRIARLQSEIARLRELAKHCDKDIARKMQSLAKEMEETARQMQDALAASNARERE